MRSTLLMLLALLGLAGSEPYSSSTKFHLDAPVGDLSCKSAVGRDQLNGGAVICIYVPSNGDAEAIYKGSLKTELSDAAVDQPTHWIVRSMQNSPLGLTSIGQTFSGGGDPSDGRVRTLMGQDDESVRLELDPLAGATGPKWTTAVMSLKLISAQA